MFEDVRGEPRPKKREQAFALQRVWRLWGPPELYSGKLDHSGSAALYLWNLIRSLQARSYGCGLRRVVGISDGVILS